jgi:hypothetical protein
MLNLFSLPRREFMLMRFHGRKLRERFNQYLASKRSVEVGCKTVHIICVRKKAYLKAAIRCANSIWFHNASVQIVFHLDSQNVAHSKHFLRKLHRRDRAILLIESNFQSWQELKLRVILHDLDSNSFFSDADLYWNGPLPNSQKGMYFVTESSKLNDNPYGTVISAAGITIGCNTFMANTSFMFLGEGTLDHQQFAAEVEEIFENLRLAAIKVGFEEKIQEKVIRLSEQIALSIAINKRLGSFEPLKLTDRPMDGGIAESYYLGTTKGWV